ncbi:sugar porter family MFS transporter [Bradyrhizobium centrolobii]|uniref:sugar porter family MFS transporter n=1 Tax=Bradyrhizobium centrolobii TaxID=1505087 RepID=UPI0007C43E31|nr:sugar porter family MFS transporter [Bradyrhizobium centrolobii]
MKTTPPGAETLTFWLAIVIVVVIFAGGLFGYDQGVISGALPGIKSTFSLSVLMLQVVTSWVNLGALVGSLIAGNVGDAIGRKRALMLAGALFTLGAAVQYLAAEAFVLVAGRLVIGIGVGVAAVAAPLYAAELAPASLRGRFIASYQLAVTIGIFLAYLVNAHLSASGNWRMMLGAAAVPGLALFVAALVTPQSPRWLIMKNRRAEARAAAHKVEPHIDVDAHLDAIELAFRTEEKPAPWSEIFHREWRHPLLVAVGLAIFQQITGINAIIYYANQIFASAGFASPESQAEVTTWAIGGVNVLATLIAIAFIDNEGRRKLLLTGLIGMGASLVVVGVAFEFIGAAGQAPAAGGPTLAGIVTVAALILYIACFAFSLGPVVWTVINEVFPARVRGRGVALATAVNWGSSYLVSQFFLSLDEAIGSSLTFWLFALLCAIAWIWIYRSVPETKRKSLEDIQRMWAVQR